MKYIIFSFLIFLLSACSTSEMRTTQTISSTGVSSEAKIDPYEIGSVDTAFKLLGPDHKIEVG